jgi:hypothetical protein
MASQYPCIVVENGQVRIIGVALLKDGRYVLTKDTNG